MLSVSFSKMELSIWSCERLPELILLKVGVYSAAWMEIVVNRTSS